ncbi:MAG: hypothetical protein V3T92_02680 [Anaerolineae bacterium]
MLAWLWGLVYPLVADLLAWEYLLTVGRAGLVYPSGVEQVRWGY